MASEDRAEYDRGDGHAVEFVTATELRELDADPVLNRADYWQEGGRP